MQINFLQIEIPTEAIDSNNIQSENIPVEETLSIISLMTSGGIGAQIIMSFMVILSFLMIYIFVNRMSALKRANAIDSEFMSDIKDYISSGKLDSAIELCKRSNSPISRMIEKGISRIGKPLQDISASIENQGKLEIQRLEKNLPYLATIAGGAPMLGFLGTVIGMIVAFHEMASAGGNIDVEMLSKGIYTAMVTTVGGLVVGIIAYIAYNFLVSKIDKVIFQLEARTTEFLDLLHLNE